MTEHKTRRGALLAALEHDRLRAGHYLVEGHEVWRLPSGTWLVRHLATKRPEAYRAPSLTDALEWVAERVHLR